MKIVLFGIFLLGASICGLLAFSCTSTIPQWAFAGAYAKYQITQSYQVSSFETVPMPGGPRTLVWFYTIINVDYQNQSFNYSYPNNISGSKPSSYDKITASFDNPSFFPIIKATDLALLNRGISPSDLSGSSVKPGIIINIQAGKFQADEIIEPSGGTIWLDMNSGLLLKSSGRLSGLPYIAAPLGSTATELAETNIPTNKFSNFPINLMVLIISSVVVIGGIISYLVIRKRIFTHSNSIS